MQVAICDDERSQAEYLKTLVKKWASVSGILITIKSFFSAEAFLFEYDVSPVFDIVILDIEMGKMNGVELAKEIRTKDKLVQIIFVTGYMDYISEGYDVEALNYLLKPVAESKFYDVLDRACDHLKREEKQLILQTKEGVVRLSLHQIQYVEVNRNYVTVHAGEEYSLKRTLSEMEKELDKRFVRTGRSFLVNMSYIKRISKASVFLKDGTEVPLSRKMYEEVNQKFIQYF